MARNRCTASLISNLERRPEPERPAVRGVPCLEALAGVLSLVGHSQANTQLMGWGPSKSPENGKTSVIFGGLNRSFLMFGWLSLNECGSRIGLRFYSGEQKVQGLAI